MDEDKKEDGQPHHQDRVFLHVMRQTEQQWMCADQKRGHHRRHGTSQTPCGKSKKQNGDRRGNGRDHAPGLDDGLRLQGYGRRPSVDLSQGQHELRMA
jgi:hypothetical protein